MHTINHYIYGVIFGSHTLICVIKAGVPDVAKPPAYYPPSWIIVRIVNPWQDQPMSRKGILPSYQDSCLEVVAHDGKAYIATLTTCLLYSVLPCEVETESIGQQSNGPLWTCEILSHASPYVSLHSLQTAVLQVQRQNVPCFPYSEDQVPCMSPYSHDQNATNGALVRLSKLFL